MSWEILIQALGILLNSLPYFALCYMPVWGNLRVPKRLVCLLMGFFAAVQAVSIIVIIALADDWTAYRLPHTILSTLLYMIVYLTTVRSKPFKLLFVILIVKCYADTVTTLAKFLELTYFAPDNGESFQLAFNAFHLLLLLLTMPFMTVLMLKKVRQVIDSDVRAWKFIWVIPLSLYGMNVSFSMMDTSLIKAGQFAVFDLILLVTSYAIYTITLEMLIKTKTNAENEERVRIAEDILSIQIRQYKNLSDSIEASRRLNHDMRHQFALLNELSAKDSLEPIREYLARMTAEFPIPSQITLCENFAVNALLCHYARLCQEHKIEFKCRTVLNNDLPIPDPVLCVLFGNCVENAIEACDRISTADTPKYIDLTAATSGTSFILSMSNSSDGKSQKADDIFLSGKRKSEAGIGLPSIKNLAEKHAGFAEFSEEGCIFHTKILMNMTAGQDFPQSEQSLSHLPFG